eukprot:TRINITY_DN4584_c0_g1_i1.p1 TRINITY_DN4584_c0_g1~~TRINITY_DN4584_c0_g1_i1.p1  ORF type:complete len:604 (+),score=118.35 TRINITY_DN4584_c0_g1_i1:1158-2969(+)
MSYHRREQESESLQKRHRSENSQDYGSVHAAEDPETKPLVHDTGSASGTNSNQWNNYCCCCPCTPRKKKIGVISVVSFFALIVIGICIFYFGVVKKGATYENAGSHDSYPPDQPLPVGLVDSNCTTIHVAWQKPNGRTAQILHYVVNMSGKASVSEIVDAPNVDTYFTKLLGNSTYCFTVSACSSVGCGYISNEACYETDFPEVPARVQSLRILKTTNSSFTIEWDDVDNRGSFLDRYEVYAKESSGDYLEYCHGLNTSCRLTDLNPSTDYSVRVRAHNSVGFSNFSDEYVFHTNSNNATTPGAPKDFSAPDVERTLAVLEWAAPDDDGGAEIIDYHVQLAADPDFENNPVYASSNSALTLSLSSLSTSTAYYARVRAKNLIGDGEWSSVLSFTTPDAGAPLAPHAVEIVATSPSFLTVHWDIPDDQGAQITSYEVAMDNGWFGLPIQSTLNTSSPEANLTSNLVPASTYNVEVRAYNRVGAGTWSSVFQFRTDQTGSCGDSSDVAIFSKLRNTIRPTIQASFFRCIASGEACAINDIVSTTGLTHDCATCWGNLGECTLAGCALQCLNPKSQACEDCSRSKCFPAAQTCTGLPLWLLNSLPS